MIKKAFFDMWDHFLPIIILNLGFIIALSVPLLLPYVLVNVSTILSMVSLAVGIVLVFVYAGAVAMAVRDIADYKTPEFKQFFVYLQETWVSSLVIALIYVAHVILLAVALPVYAGMQSLLGLAALMFLVWASLIWLIASQFFFPIRSRLDTNIKKILKKCFIIFFDNTWYALFSAIGVVAIALLSGFTAFLIPGFAGVLLWVQVGFKIRLYKYDYLEQNPDANRKKLPWDAILIDDKERVGKRTLRGMIFPWKE